MSLELDAGTIGIIITLIGQTAFAIWWASNITARLGQLEKEGRYNHDLGTRMARVETLIEAQAAWSKSMQQDIRDIKDALMAGRDK